MLGIFAVTVAVLLAVMPGPRKATDFLVIGCVATLLCLLLLFVVITKSKPRRDPTEPRAGTEPRP